MSRGKRGKATHVPVEQGNLFADMPLPQEDPTPDFFAETPTAGAGADHVDEADQAARAAVQSSGEVSTHSAVGIDRHRSGSDDVCASSTGLGPTQLPGSFAEALRQGAELLCVLDLWLERGWLRALDRAFVVFLDQLRPHCDPRVLLAAALASHQLGHGHVCLDLGATLDNPDFALSLPPEGDAGRGAVPLPSEVLEGLDADAWQAALAASPLVALQEGALSSAADRPMVLVGQRLYLRRYWRYEKRIGASLRMRLAARLPVPHDLAARLATLFPGGGRDGQAAVDWQKLACALAARGTFSIVTGGPGTGKTTTVIRLLALLQTPAVEAGQPLRIRLAAPTGKAAARLSTSIGEQVSRLDVAQEVRAAIPTDVTTLHRLLGSRPDTRHFRHHAGHQLPLDVLIVDEASMIDLEMMASLLDALPAHARLVLLGDKDQLASVEAGAVLGDLCQDAEAGRYSAETRAWLEQVGDESLANAGLAPGDELNDPLAQQTVMLRYSRRFGEGSGIGRLARLVNDGLADEAQALLVELGKRPGGDTLYLQPDASGAIDALLMQGRAGIGHGYAHYLEVLRDNRPPAGLRYDDPAWSVWASAVLAAFDEFQLLCTVRKGDYGVEGLNRRIAGALLGAGLIASDEGWYEGRPVLVTRNDYSLGLMNGDVGIALSLPDGEPVAGSAGRQVLRVAFPRNDGTGSLRFVLPSRLSAVETVFAMTVHKSQGSEFAHTALILPDAINPVLTKELVYTGITRARHGFSLIEPKRGVFKDAVSRKVTRLSGLVLQLTGNE